MAPFGLNPVPPSRPTSVDFSDAALPERTRPGITRDRVLGVLLGTAVGDALGMPVETYAPERIAAEFGFITRFEAPRGHKWFDGAPPGLWTDDTRLTLALLEGLSVPQPDMPGIAAAHVRAKRAGVLGWGRSTLESIERLEAGISWEQSGRSTKPGMGTGNGAAMKIAPAALYAEAKGLSDEELHALAADIALMTHATPVGLASACAHAAAVRYCLRRNPQSFEADEFIDAVTSAARRPGEPNLCDRFAVLEAAAAAGPKTIRRAFGGGTCPVYNSLPFSYAFFLRNPGSTSALYETVNAGGDTDTNGALVGSLLGALCGTAVLPRELTAALHNREEISAAAEAFCRCHEVP